VAGHGNLRLLFEQRGSRVGFIDNSYVNEKEEIVMDLKSMSNLMSYEFLEDIGDRRYCFRGKDLGSCFGRPTCYNQYND